MAELHHECGIVAVYHLPDRGLSPLLPVPDPDQASRLIPRMLLDVQNRGQLAAGITTYDPSAKPANRHAQGVGTVAEVFHLNHAAEYEKLMLKYNGPAGSATCDMPPAGRMTQLCAAFRRHHIEKSKWFSFASTGNWPTIPSCGKSWFRRGTFIWRAKRYRNPDATRSAVVTFGR